MKVNKSQVMFFVRRHLRALEEIVEVDQLELANKRTPYEARREYQRDAEENRLEHDAVRAAADFLLEKLPETFEIEVGEPFVGAEK